MHQDANSSVEAAMPSSIAQIEYPFTLEELAARGRAMWDAMMIAIRASKEDPRFVSMVEFFNKEWLMLNWAIREGRYSN